MAMSTGEEALEEEACLPAGYRFSPTDMELIVFYLHNHPSPNPLSKAVQEIADFDYFTPWTLHDLFSLKRVDACYFLTHRKCGGGKPKDNHRIGYWKPTGKDCSISIGAVDGVHKAYTYYMLVNCTPPEMKTNWMMQEYQIRELDHQDKKPRKEFRRVLCKIYKKGMLDQNSHRIDQALPTMQHDVIGATSYPNSFSHLDKFAYLDGYYHQLLANFGFTPSVNHHLSDPLEELHPPLEFPPWMDRVEELQSLESPSMPFYDSLWDTDFRTPLQRDDDRIRDTRGRREGKDVQWSKHEEESFPIGVRFEPTDQEIFSYFLMKEPCKQPKVIHEIDVYQYDPWTLQMFVSDYMKPRTLQSMYPMSRVSDIYFITSLSRKYPQGQRPKRTTGGGVWKSTSVKDHILYKCGNPVGGVCTSLVYLKGMEEVKTNWLMKEFRLGEVGEEKLNKTDENNLKEWNPVTLDGVVLCKLYENKRIKQPNGTKEDELKVGDAEDMGGTFLKATSETHILS